MTVAVDHRDLARRARRHLRRGPRGLGPRRQGSPPRRVPSTTKRSRRASTIRSTTARRRSVRSTVAFIEGRYDDAAALSDEAYRLGQAGGDVNAELLHYAQGLLQRSRPRTGRATSCLCSSPRPTTSTSPRSRPAPHCARRWPATTRPRPRILEHRVPPRLRRSTPRRRLDRPDCVHGPRLQCHRRRVGRRRRSTPRWPDRRPRSCASVRSPAGGARSTTTSDASRGSSGVSTKPNTAYAVPQRSNSGWAPARSQRGPPPSWRVSCAYPARPGAGDGRRGRGARRRRPGGRHHRRGRLDARCLRWGERRPGARTSVEMRVS